MSKVYRVPRESSGMFKFTSRQNFPDIDIVLFSLSERGRRV
jgi:hypothetical protein